LPGVPWLENPPCTRCTSRTAGQASEAIVRHRLSELATRAGMSWCRLIHRNSPMWPMHERYMCRKCYRVFPAFGKTVKYEPRPDDIMRSCATAHNAVESRVR
jgi:hypothetical protein